MKNVFILGAGISGLTVARSLAEHETLFSVAIIEKENCVGGLAKTFEEDGVYYDAGPHLFHTAHANVKDYWESAVGTDLVAKEFYGGNYQGGKLYDYPVNLETAHLQYRDDELNIIKHELSDHPQRLESLSEAQNYAEYVECLAGSTLAKKFFTKYPEKLWGIKTNNLSARFAPKRVEIREKRIPFHSGDGRFCGVIEGGCGKLAERYLEDLKSLSGSILTSNEVVGLETDKNKITKIRLSNKTIDCEDALVISTLPVTTLSQLLGLETTLYFRSVTIVSIYCESDDLFPENYDWLYFDDDSFVFHRVGIQTRFSKRGLPDNAYILCAEIMSDDLRDGITDDELCSVVVQSLTSLNFIDPGSIKNTFVKHLGPVYPGYFLGHEMEVARVKAFHEKHMNLYAVGSLAEYAYSDLQVLTSKALDLGDDIISHFSGVDKRTLRTQNAMLPAKQFYFGKNIVALDTSAARPLTIAEIGLNHNGSVEQCKRLILSAKEAGFNIAKLQTYKSGRVSKKTRRAKYYEETLDQEESISTYLDRIIFSPSEFTEILRYAEKVGIDLFSTPFDVESAEFLASMNVPGFKISSMDVTNLPLLRHVAKTGKPIILSTGTASLGDIELALNEMLHFNNKLAILHCVSAYPCPIELSNLARIKKLSDTFGVITGFSDHTIEVETPAFAVLAGARIIEKHITLNRGMDGPDHNFSLEPEDMKRCISLVNSAYSSITHNMDSTADIERDSRNNLRRSIYMKKSCPPGTVITPEIIEIKSPGDGLDPKYFDLIMGKRLLMHIDEDCPLKWDYLLNE